MKKRSTASHKTTKTLHLYVIKSESELVSELVSELESFQRCLVVVGPTSELGLPGMS